MKKQTPAQKARIQRERAKAAKERYAREKKRSSAAKRGAFTRRKNAEKKQRAKKRELSKAQKGVAGEVKRLQKVIASQQATIERISREAEIIRVQNEMFSRNELIAKRLRQADEKGVLSLTLQTMSREYNMSVGELYTIMLYN